MDGLTIIDTEHWKNGIAPDMWQISSENYDLVMLIQESELLTKLPFLANSGETLLHFLDLIPQLYKMTIVR